MMFHEPFQNIRSKAGNHTAVDARWQAGMLEVPFYPGGHIDPYE
jgi:hypothetical protein